MNEQLRVLYRETRQSRVFGDTFADEDPLAVEAWAEAHLGELAGRIAAETAAIIIPGTPEWDDQTISREIEASTDKTTMFGVVLTSGVVRDPELLVHFGTPVNGMYVPNNQVDGGGRVADVTIDAIGQLVDTDVPRLTGPAEDHLVRARLTALLRMGAHIDAFALPEDAPYVRDCFYEQVLKNEVTVQLLSREYQATPPQHRGAFLARRAADFVIPSVISAGFPSISSSMYSLFRHEYPLLPPLSEVYASEHMVKLLQVSNVFARLLDELGDWRKDGRGLDRDGPVPHTFVLNVFNQYHPAVVDKYCELGFIPASERSVLHESVADFHSDELAHGGRVVEALCKHIKRYYEELPADTRATFRGYIGAAKRVGEISLVNARGDEALSTK